MTVYARRYYWADVSPLDNTALLDAFVAHPEFLSYPYPPNVARVVAATLVTDPSNVVWATYDNATLTGLVILTRIVPKVDALLHFLMIDQNLAGKRKLLKNLLGYCFTDMGFHRLSMEVPEGTRLERFARKALSFRFEGEIRDRPPELSKALDNIWMAKQGSRRESSYFNGETWSDVALLRLLASEWAGETGGTCRLDQPQPQLEPPLSEG